MALRSAPRSHASRVERRNFVLRGTITFLIDDYIGLYLLGVGGIASAPSACR